MNSGVTAGGINDFLCSGYSGPVRGRNNSKISSSQQDYLVGKSGSPQIYGPARFKQNNMTNQTFDKYSLFWQSIGLLLSLS